MDFMNIGDNINYSDYNALVYLLRKFKKLSTILQIGANDLTTEYGKFHFSDGFENIGNNFIINNDVTVISNSVLPNAFYKFIFTVLDVNLSGNVNKRTVEIESGTGEYGNLELTIPANLIEENEVILPNFNVEVVFDEHEYYTPIIDINVFLEVNKKHIEVGETAIIRARLTNINDEPLSNVEIILKINSINHVLTTDKNGIIIYSYVGTDAGKITVKLLDKTEVFYDMDDILNAVFEGDRVVVGNTNYPLYFTDSVTIDWSDNTYDIVDYPRYPSIHKYSDGLNEHTVKFLGTVRKIRYYCFSGCTNLISINIPHTVDALFDGCFYGCSSLIDVDIPNSVTSIGNNCFQGCTGLIHVDIPNSVTSIGGGCFIGCSSLIDVDIPNSVTSIDNKCFQGCSSLIDVDIPNSVTSIGQDCFYNCKSLENIVIPNSVTSIGKACFYGCSSLIDVDISNSVTSLDNSVFSYCMSLESIVIPNSVTSIGKACFQGCSSLIHVDIPNSVTSIGQDCFYNCKSLESIVIPNSVTSIGEGCFNYCYSLIDCQLYWESSPIPYNYMPNRANTIFTIPKGTTQIYIDANYPSEKLRERTS